MLWCGGYELKNCTWAGEYKYWANSSGFLVFVKNPALPLLSRKFAHLAQIVVKQISLTLQFDIKQNQMIWSL